MPGGALGEDAGGNAEGDILGGYPRGDEMGEMPGRRNALEGGDTL